LNTPLPALPCRLFGRDHETAQLAGALARVRETGHSEVILMSGGAGTGKSALAEWLSRHGAADGAQFACGKSDPLQRDIPFGPVAQIIRSLTMTLLRASEPTLVRMRDRWLARLAGQGRAVAELVPEVEQVLGPTAPLANVPAQQAQARVESAVLRSFGSFAAHGTPLIIFIDDLQWADVSTIALLRAFMCAPPDDVLLVGAYRDERPEMPEQLSWLLRGNRLDTMPITHIAVTPLDEDALAALIGAALKERRERVRTLAHAIHPKTAGNPFFSHHLLCALIEEGVLRYRSKQDGWEWNEADIASGQYGDSVVGLLMRRFARVPDASAELLRQFACVGIRSDETLLARLAQTSVAGVETMLCPLVDAGLLLRERNGYAFAHDRVLESAYAMIPIEARPRAHARVAGLMIEHWHDQLADFAYEICNQIERAADHQPTADERVAFVRVLVVASRRARRTAALAQAARYVDSALSMMDESWWSSHYELAYAASLLRCECQLAQADLVNASAGIDALLHRPLAPIDRAAVHRLKAALQTVRSDYEGAIAAALSGLAQLGIHLQRRPTSEQKRAARDAVSTALRGRPVTELGTLAATEDRRIQTIMGLLSTLVSSFFVEDGISFTHVAKMVELTLEHGATPESPYALSWFGVFIASLYDEYEKGLAYALAAMTLIDRHGYEAERIATLVALDQVSPWTRPLSFALGHAQTAGRLGRASGDIGMACYACNHIASDLLAMGEPLQLVEEEIERGLALTRLIEYRDIQLILYAQKHFARRLHADAQVTLQGSEAAPPLSTNVALRIERSNSLSTKFFVWLYDGMASVFLHEWDAATTSLERAAELTWSAPAHINVADWYLYTALATAHTAAASSRIDAALALLDRHHARFDGWAQLNPQTFRSKRLLVDAERLRLRGARIEALARYEQSAEAAAAAGFVHEQALAHELAGLLCNAHALHSSGKHHLRAAHTCYRRWGAERKAKLLERAHPELSEPRMHEPGAAGIHGERSVLGWALGVKAARAMSREVVMERLIETLMTHVILHAGAQYGLLLLVREDGPVIEASGRLDGERVAVTLGSALPTEQALPLIVLNSVLRTKETFVLGDAMAEAPSIRAGSPGTPLRSLLCLPLLRGGVLIGVVYLENNRAPDVFDANLIAELEVLAPQVALSLETARLYEQLINESNRRLAAEMDLRTARAELTRRSHLTVMGSLAASITHEVNQPLTAIIASVDASLRWLNRTPPDLDEVQAGLAHVKETSLRTAEIIRALRSLAKQAPAVLAPLNIDDLVRGVLNMVRMEIDAHRVRVVRRLHVGAAMVEGDRVQLQQVVLNLITNALEAMAETPDEKRELVATSICEQGEVVVGIRDYGCGIADDALGRVFDPFFTTKPSGMGMGLAICRSIVEAHGGSLAALAKSDGGSEFVFRLPVAKGADDTPPP